MIKVFAPQMQIDCYQDWFTKDNADFIKVTNVNDICNEKIKIAAIPMHYEKYDPDNKYSFNPAEFDLCLISDVEQNTVEECKKWAQALGIKNYCLAVGSLEFLSLKELPNNTLYRPWWMYNLLDRNKIPIIDQKEKFLNFDVLLGAKKLHRDFVMAKFQATDMLDANLVNYRSVFVGDYGDNIELAEKIKTVLNGSELQYPYVSNNLQADWEVKATITKDVSAIIPWKIYDQTKYSVVCESNYERGFFATEKTGKPLIAKRLFIVFAPPNFLQNLQDLGFKTFHGIIDESYDQEVDIVKRFEMAFEQINWLSSQDYFKIQQQAASVFEHNQSHLINLRQETKLQMQKMVYNKLKEIKHVNSV